MTDVPFVQNRAEEKWAQGTKDRRRGDRATVTQTVSTPPVKRHIVKKDKNKDQPYAAHKKLTLNIKTNEK